MKTKNLTLIALMAALICIFGPLTLPIGVIPISLCNLAIYISIIILGKNKSTIAVFLYLLIGFVGVPVFSGFSAGASKLLGPTGGYLLGYLLLTWIAGAIIEKTKDSVWMNFAALLAGTAVLYLLGTIWLAKVANLTFGVALANGVVPFVLLDCIKMWVAILLGRTVNKRLVQSGLL